MSMIRFCGMRLAGRAWHIGVIVLALGAALADGRAQTTRYPDKPIKILVGFAAGGGTDVAARILAQKMQEALQAAQSIGAYNLPPRDMPYKGGKLVTMGVDVASVRNLNVRISEPSVSVTRMTAPMKWTRLDSARLAAGSPRRLSWLPTST